MFNSIPRGIIYILIATFAFAIMNVMAKELSAMHPMQVVFFRAFGTFIFIVPYILLKKVPILGTHRKILLLRAIIGCISLITFFIALQRIPLGSAISIRYLGPIFGAVLAYYFLKENVNRYQWFSFGIAFLGVIMLKGFDLRIDLLSFILVLISALLVGMVFVLLRYLSDKEHYLTIILYFMTICLIAGLLFISKWRMPYPEEWVCVLSIGIFGLIGQVFMTRAFQTEETSILAPFKYMELVYALIMGFMFFGETYTLLPLLGIVLIVIGMIMNVMLKTKKA